jgi:ABC-type multidrug transport system fused ATPase/permease subunit
MNGRIAYASQVPFILNGSVRENILFGLPFRQELYEKVIEACNLAADLKQLGPAGDFTEIGERGVTLSGGQKARVSLARCVYSQSDIVLLDDILSALDAATGKMIFDQLLDNSGSSYGLMEKSAVILVTHSTHFLSRVDKILVLSRGKSIFFGSWLELLHFTPPDSSTASVISSIVSSLQEEKMSDDHLEGDEEGTQRPRYESDKLSNELGKLIKGKPIDPYS